MPPSTNGMTGLPRYNSNTERISLDTRLRQQSRSHDPVSRHLLHETALLDTQGYEILTIDEVDVLKKEHDQLNGRIEAAERKLRLESKVKDAAQNLQRLYSRADTPQSPTSPKRPRRSILGQRRTSSITSSEGSSLNQAGEEFVSSTAKVEELNEALKGLLHRRQYVERKLLRHTAAILAEQKNEQTHEGANGASNGRREIDEDEDESSDYGGSMYSPDEFDGIRDILVGRPPHSIHKLQKRARTQKLQEEHEQQLQRMQARLEHLNSQLRSVISEASKSRGAQLPAEPQYGRADTHDPAEKLNSDFDRLENNLRHLQQEQQDTRSHYTRTQDNLLRRHAEELHDAQANNGQIEQIRAEAAQEIEQAHLTSSTTIQRLSERQAEYEATVSGLWEIMQSEEAPSTPNPEKGPGDAGFSLQAFNSSVQHLFDRATGAREQHDILRRQIQQQRELNGKSDAGLAEKDRRVADLTAQHEGLLVTHHNLQDELAKALAEAQVARETTEANDERLAEDIAALESEVVRLTTERTMAQAELDSAYGSRAERAKEAQAGDASRAQTLENELAALTADFQDLAHESLQLERERGQLDALIDGLRDRVETLETQASDEKVRWLGVKSPAAGTRDSLGSNGNPKESISVTAMRAEFKKMMREVRSEGVKLLRAEQTERRRLEAELRRYKNPSSTRALTPRTGLATGLSNGTGLANDAGTSLSNGLAVNSNGSASTASIASAMHSRGNSEAVSSA